MGWFVGYAHPTEAGIAYDEYVLALVPISRYGVYVYD
jgi:hypothetical protein